MNNNVSFLPTAKNKLVVMSDSLLVMGKLGDELIEKPFSEWKAAFHAVHKELSDIHHVDKLCPTKLLDDFFEVIRDSLFYTDAKPSAFNQFNRYIPLFNFCLSAAYIESLPEAYRQLTGETLDESLTFLEIDKIFITRESFLVVDPYVIQAMLSTLNFVGADPSEINEMMRGAGKKLACRELNQLSIMESAGLLEIIRNEK